MGTRFEPAPDLDARLAQTHGRPLLERVLSDLEREARRRAPDTRVWITARDERVRDSHVETDAQVVPDNLRFKIPKVDSRGRVTGFGYDLARHPRDPDLPIEQAINCRCQDQTLPHLLRDSIHRGDVTVVGTRAQGTVETRFPRAAESENGTDQDQAARFMAGALAEVAARLRARGTRAP